MPQIRAFISDNIKSLTIVASFLISMYIQHLNNTTRIDALADRCDRIELRLEDQYQKIDAIKVDKTVFEATMQQFTSMQDDLKEMRRDIKEILEKFPISRQKEPLALWFFFYCYFCRVFIIKINP